MRLRLEIAVPGMPKKVFDHPGPTVQIGRDPAAELSLPADQVSSRHARIELSPRGANIVDLGSTNGTYVNSQRIGAPTPIAVGDWIGLGVTGPQLRVAQLDLSGPAAPVDQPTTPERLPDWMAATGPTSELSSPVPVPPLPKPARVPVASSPPAASKSPPVLPGKPSGARSERKSAVVADEPAPGLVEPPPPEPVASAPPVAAAAGRPPAPPASHPPAPPAPPVGRPQRPTPARKPPRTPGARAVPPDRESPWIFHTIVIVFSLLAVVGLGLLVRNLGLGFGSDDLKGKRYALLVGINEYRDERLPKLRFAVNDVTELDKLLRGKYEIVLLTDEEGKRDPKHIPTRHNIEKELKDLRERCQAGDLLLVAFAGHGVQFQGGRGAFFCPVDGVPVENQSETLVSLKTIYEELGTSRAGVRLLMVDACRDDPSSARAAKTATRTGIDLDSAPPPAGVAALFSCKAGERAFEIKDLRHGLFFHHVLQGLKGKAANQRNEITWGGLEEYVQREVPLDFRNRFKEPEFKDASQTPTRSAHELAGTPPVLLTLPKLPGLNQSLTR